METSRVIQKGNKRWHGVVALLLFICSTPGPPQSTHGKVLISQAQNFLNCKYAQANAVGELGSRPEVDQILTVDALGLQKAGRARHVAALQPARNFAHTPRCHRELCGNSRGVRSLPCRLRKAEHDDVSGIGEPMVGGQHVNVLRTQVKRCDNCTATKREGVCLFGTS